MQYAVLVRIVAISNIITILRKNNLRAKYGPSGTKKVSGLNERWMPHHAGSGGSADILAVTEKPQSRNHHIKTAIENPAAYQSIV